MITVSKLLVALTLASCGTALAADWPTYRNDYARTGVSPDPLPRNLVEAWSWRSAQLPQPAWQGEAKWDGWNKVYDLKARQTFDRVFHAVIASGRVYFGSSADDQVYCLDAKTGRELWTFFTEGPVRFTPTIVNGRAYFGSDDGRVYCLDATSGKLVWQQRAVETDRRIPGNGRVISNWPIRTSVVVQNGLVYTTAGMFPSEGVHLVALDAATGAVKWRQVQSDLPAQGYLLASATRLYVPSGRNNPIVCDITDGKRLHVVEGAGGTYALLNEGMLVFGPGKTGQLGAVEEGRKDQLATFQGNHMIVVAGRSYLHSDTEISVLDRARYLELAREQKALSARQGQLAKELRELGKKTGTEAEQQKIKDQLADLGRKIDATTEGMNNCVLWRSESRWALSLALAGDTLVLGGDGEIAGFHTERGTLRWQHKVKGGAYGLAAADGMLLVSTDEGVIHCLRAPAAHAALVPARDGKEVRP
jgi:outer membrane protein assembly factor BamB